MFNLHKLKIRNTIGQVTPNKLGMMSTALLFLLIFFEYVLRLRVTYRKTIEKKNVFVFVPSALLVYCGVWPV